MRLFICLIGRWAAIASYLPQRTDNDIKNYWNTHLRKKLGKIQGYDDKSENGSSSDSQSISKGKWERRLQTDIHTAKQALCEALSLDKSHKSESKLLPIATGNKPIPPCTYASSAENIARLLENWGKKAPKSTQSESTQSTANAPSIGFSSSPSEGTISPPFFGSNSEGSVGDQEAKFEGAVDERKPNNLETQMPLSLLEKWLLDDAGAQGQDGDFMDMALGETADLF